MGSRWMCMREVTRTTKKHVRMMESLETTVKRAWINRSHIRLFTLVRVPTRPVGKRTWSATPARSSLACRLRTIGDGATTAVRMELSPARSVLTTLKDVTEATSRLRIRTYKRLTALRSATKMNSKHRGHTMTV